MATELKRPTYVTYTDLWSAATPGNSYDASTTTYGVYEVCGVSKSGWVDFLFTGATMTQPWTEATIEIELQSATIPSGSEIYIQTQSPIVTVADLTSSKGVVTYRATLAITNLAALDLRLSLYTGTSGGTCGIAIRDVRVIGTYQDSSALKSAAVSC